MEDFSAACGTRLAASVPPSASGRQAIVSRRLTEELYDEYTTHGGRCQTAMMESQWKPSHYIPPFRATILQGRREPSGLV